jgi:hypothetical protein
MQAAAFPRMKGEKRQKAPSESEGRELEAEGLSSLCTRKKYKA